MRTEWDDRLGFGSEGDRGAVGGRPSLRVSRSSFPAVETFQTDRHRSQVDLRARLPLRLGHPVAHRQSGNTQSLRPVPVKWTSIAHSLTLSCHLHIIIHALQASSPPRICTFGIRGPWAKAQLFVLRFVT